MGFSYKILDIMNLQMVKEVVLLILVGISTTIMGQVLMEGSCPPIPVMKNFSPDKVSFLKI